MGSSRIVGSKLLGFLSDVIRDGPHEALRDFNLENLVGRPIDEIFVQLSDYICPAGGTVDEGIAREAFSQTIVDIIDEGVTDLNGLTVDQMLTVLELYATNAIEIRICNDIGAGLITLPSDAREARSVYAQLRDFVRRGVADALDAVRDRIGTLTPENATSFVDQVYQQTFEVLETLGDAEAQQL